uniref:Uncharacterized protein n=1 Tax=Glossina pallidipes TaxID=7398 RepID=A0A1A9Z4K5_GLOPL
MSPDRRIQKKKKTSFKSTMIDSSMYMQTNSHISVTISIKINCIIELTNRHHQSHRSLDCVLAPISSWYALALTIVPMTIHARFCVSVIFSSTIENSAFKAHRRVYALKDFAPSPASTYYINLRMHQAVEWKGIFFLVTVNARIRCKYIQKQIMAAALQYDDMMMTFAFAYGGRFCNDYNSYTDAVTLLFLLYSRISDFMQRNSITNILCDI